MLTAGRGAGALLVLAGVAGLTACAAGPDRVVEAQDTIAGVLAERLSVDADEVTVTCPADDPLLPGSTLTCSVVVDGGDAVDVAFALGAGEGDPARLTEAVVPTAAAETYLEGELAAPAEGPVAADCGDEPLLVREVGATFTCAVTRTADAATFDVLVTVLALDGTVRHQVLPTTTTVPPTTAPPTTVATP